MLYVGYFSLTFFGFFISFGIQTSIDLDYYYWDIDCGPPAIPSNGRVDFNETIANSTAVTTCNAGYAIASPGYSISMCNNSGLWETVEGTDWKSGCGEIGKHVGCMTLSNASTLLEIPGIKEQLPTKNLNECLKSCKNLTYLYTARQGDRCYCTSTIQNYQLATGCVDLCYDNLSYCGGAPDKYSVFSSIDKCVDIKNTSALPYIPMTQVRTGLTCIQLCIAKEFPLAFYKHAREECYCLTDLPSYSVAVLAGCFKVAVNENKTFDYQALEITALHQTFSSCEELYENGVFYHGEYMLTGGVKVNCSFYDTSRTCDRDWIAYDGNCYLFLTAFGNATEQFKRCRQSNGHLATIRSVQDLDFFRSFTENLSPSHSENFYVGLYDIQEAFTYMWSDEARVSYRPFTEGYPINLEASCIQWDSRSNAIINVLCDNNAYGICEQRQEVPGCMVVPEGSLGTPLLDSPSMSSPLCFETCRAQGQKYSATRDNRCYCYADISNLSRVDWDTCDTPCPVHPFQFCGGTADNTVFVIEDNDQPFRSGCDEMILEGLSTNVSQDASQNQTDPGSSDCTSAAGDKCPEFWLEIDGNCYRYFRESTVSPFTTCLTFNAYTAVFESNAEQENVLQIIRDFPALDEAADVWIFGKRYIRGDSSFLRYSNGAWLNETTEEAEPDYPAFCLALNSQGQVGEDPVQCDKNAFICEKNDDFKGCCLYPENGDDVLIISDYPELTVRLCLEACKPTGFPYAGISMAKTCVCSKAYQPATNGTLCDLQCAGFQGCGSADNNYVSVYTVDYSRNATSCQELFNQGVLLNGLYSLADGKNTWCGMKDSSYLTSYASSCAGTQSCDYTRHYVGVNESVFSVDIIASVKHPDLVPACQDILTPASIVVNVKEAWPTKMVTDTLRWLLESPNSIPTYIGAVDEFNMGIYTWSNGDIFRMSDLALTQALNYQEARSLHLTMNQAGNVTEATADTEAMHHVTCQRDTTFLGCYMTSDLVSLSPYLSISGYLSMSLGLCRQVCQAKRASEMFVSTTSCVCTDQASSEYAALMTIMTSEQHADCDVSCPASRLQRCGSEPYFRRYQFDTEHVSSCQELYDNFIVYNATYLIDGQLTMCGLDDGVTICGPGFISRKGKCYRFQRRSDLTLNEGASECMILSSYLASPVDEDERLEIEYLISQFTELRTAELWFLGYYRSFVPAFYSGASGNMYLGGRPVPPGFDDAVRAVALNISTSGYVAVSKSDKYPFICETSDVIRGTVEIRADQGEADFSMPSAMSVHQCAALCQGLQVNATLAAVRGGTCRCVKEQMNVLNSTHHTANQFCPGHPLQMCGRTDVGAFTVYDLTLFPPEYLYHSCNNFFYFGAVHTGYYVTDSNEVVDCFRLSPKTDYVMANANASNLVFNTSLSTGDMRLRVDTLSIGGWHGGNDDSIYAQVDLGEYYVMEGLVILDPTMTSERRATLSVSFDGQFFQDSDVGEIVYGPDQFIVYLTLPTPMVCKFVKLTFPGVNATSISFEILGYPYSQHSFDDNYLGCHVATGNEEKSNVTLVTYGYDECRNECRELGFSMLTLESSLNDTDSCQCLRANYTRDLYDVGHCDVTCFNDTQSRDLPCEEDGDTGSYYASYLAIDLDCPVFTINDTNVTETSVVTSQWVNVTTATKWSFVCHLGFHFNQSATSFVSTLCYNFGVWVPSVSSYRCVRVDCGSPPAPTDSSINTTVTGTLYGDVIGYACNGGEGWAFDGVTDRFEVTCLEDETWGPPIPPCSLKKCPALPELEMASLLNNQSQFVFGDNATYECQDGCHYLPDNETGVNISCLSSGQWEPITGQCIPFRCPTMPPSLPHTLLQMDGADDGQYMCEEGAEFPGRSIMQNVTCNQTSFQWTAVDACQPLVYLSGQVCPNYPDKQLNDLSLSEVPSRGLMDCASKCLTHRLCFKFSHPKQASQSISNITFSSCLLSLDGNSEEPGMADDSEWNTYLIADSC